MLRKLVREGAQGGEQELTITVPLSDAKTIHVIENRGKVLEREYVNSSVKMRVKIGARQLAQLRSMGARMKVE